MVKRQALGTLVIENIFGSYLTMFEGRFSVRTGFCYMAGLDLFPFSLGQLSKIARISLKNQFGFLLQLVGSNVSDI